MSYDWIVRPLDELISGKEKGDDYASKIDSKTRFIHTMAWLGTPREIVKDVFIPSLVKARDSIMGESDIECHTRRGIDKRILNLERYVQGSVSDFVNCGCIN